MHRFGEKCRRFKPCADNQLLVFSFFRNRRRKRWLARQEPREWGEWLERNVWQYRHLDDRQAKKIHDFVCILYHEKEWAGGGKLVVTDEMRITIAGQAALLTLGFVKPYFFERLRTIIVYPKPFRARPESTDDLLLGKHSEALVDFSARSGESWQGGPIILAWNIVLKEGQSARCGRSLVAHEFAHHMDGLDGQTDGSPPITDYEFEKRWYRVTSQEHRRLLRFARSGSPTLLDHYGAENQAEFFAVATECFITRPHALAREHGELFSVLSRLFGQDPRQWIPAQLEKAVD